MKQKIFLKAFFLFFTCLSVICIPDFSYYHTTDDIYRRVEELKGECNNLLKTSVINQDPLIHLLDINSNSKAKKSKAFILFGEHAREMISPETGLAFLEQICKNHIEENEFITKILNKYHLQLILNANPSSRKKVEDGNYCLRVNENGIDLNRNWDAHWEKSGDIVTQTASGSHPFSEIETQALKRSLDEFNPKVFLTVHSGAMGMYTPHAYSEEKGVFNENKMMNILSDLNPKYCQCSAGAAGKEVGYLCPGTCLDYAYDKLKVPYVFAWEIYERNYDFSKLILSQKMRFLQMNHKSHNLKTLNKLVKNSFLSCFVQTSTNIKSEMSEDECFEYFNPTNEESYNTVVKNWVNAMIEMLVKVDEQEE